MERLTKRRNSMKKLFPVILMLALLVVIGLYMIPKEGIVNPSDASLEPLEIPAVSACASAYILPLISVLGIGLTSGEMESNPLCAGVLIGIFAVAILLGLFAVVKTALEN